MKWIKFEDLNTMLNRSLQRSNDVILQAEGGTSFTIVEMTIDLPVFTKLLETSDEELSLYVRFPDHQEDMKSECEHEQTPPFSRVKLTLRPTVTINGFEQHEI